MKKLMLAASATVLSAVTFADVYNVKFTATTTVGATMKGVEYLKKGSVVVTGLYDDETSKYYFWTGTGAKMVPVQKAVFEILDAVDMDSAVKGKNVAFNAGLYVGEEDSLGTAFVAAGLGKVLTVGGDVLNQASGSFAGKYEGNPAYGSWSFSKNSTATKKGVADYIASQSKGNLTLEAWGDNTEIKDKIEAWREVAKDAVTNAEQVKKDLEEIARLEAVLADKTLNVEELERTKLELETAYGDLEKIWNDQKVQLAEKDATIAEKDTQLGLIDDAFKNLEDKESLKKLLHDYLDEMIVSEKAKIRDSKDQIDTINAKLEEYFHAANGDLVAEYKKKIADAEVEMKNANSDLRAAEQERDNLLAKLAYKISITNGQFFVDNKNDQDAKEREIADLEAEVKRYSVMLDEYLANVKDAQYNNATNLLISKTNEIAQLVKASDDKLAAAQAAADLAQKTLADYTLPNGNGDYSKWLNDYGLSDTADNMIAFNAFYAGLIQNDKDAASALEEASKENAQLKDDLKMTTTWLNDVIAACEKNALIGTWKTLSEKARAEFEAYEDNIINTVIPGIRAEIEDLKAKERAAKAEDLSINAFEDVNIKIEKAIKAVEEKSAKLLEAELKVKGLEAELAEVDALVKRLETAFETKYGFKPTNKEEVAAFLKGWQEVYDLSVRNVNSAEFLKERIFAAK